MADGLTLVVSLFVHPGRQAEFEEFETKASAIMRRHGGTMRRIALAPGADPAQPHEIHIVTFPDQQSYESYRADAELTSLANLRSRAIRQTIVWRGLK